MIPDAMPKARNAKAKRTESASDLHSVMCVPAEQVSGKCRESSSVRQKLPQLASNIVQRDSSTIGLETQGYRRESKGKVSKSLGGVNSKSKRWLVIANRSLARTSRAARTVAARA